MDDPNEDGMRFLNVQEPAGSVGALRFVRVFNVDALVKASTALLVPVYLRLVTQRPAAASEPRNDQTY